VLAPGRGVGAGPLEGHLLLVGGTAEADAADPLLLLDLLQLLADLAARIDRAVAEQVELDRGFLGQRQPLALLFGAVVQDAAAVSANEAAQVLLDGVELPRLVLTPDVVDLRHDAYLCCRHGLCSPGDRAHPYCSLNPTAAPTAP